MKKEKFRKSKKTFERITKREITDEEFEQRLMRQKRAQQIIWLICLIIGFSMALNWPVVWFPPFSTYLGLGLLVVVAIGVVQDLLRKEGAFFKLE